MWNVLLDPLPYEWNGYPIDTDFQTGILISQCLADEELSKNERFFTAINLLFPDEINRPDIKEAADAISWYLNEYHHDNNTNEKSDCIVLDFDIDQWRIYAAFKSQYGIDLNKERLHWFVFMGLMANLDECALTNVMNIRQKKVTGKMTAEERKAIMDAKRVFEVRHHHEEQLSEQEQQRVNEFMKYININK